MKLGTISKSKVTKWNSKGTGGKGMVPTTNSSGKPGFKSKTKAAKGPAC